MRKTFEKIIDEQSKKSEWNAEFKYELLLNYLDSHCANKTNHFEDFLEAIAKTEDSLSE